MTWFLDHPLLTAAAALLAHVAGLLHGLHALFHARTAQGSIAWMIALAVFPWVAIPLYWFFGRHRFHGYVEARRLGDVAFDRQVLTLNREWSRFEVVPDGPRAAFLDACRRLADFPLVRGNQVELLVNGEPTFRRIFEAIHAARHYVLITYYIVKNDHVGTLFHDALVRKAREGVRVYLLFDEVGSHHLPRAYLRSLREAGVQAVFFGRNLQWWSRFQINFRNHRKIVLVDGLTALIGGLNVGDEYLNGHPKLGPWRDTHLRIAGPAVDAVQLAFLEDWHWATGEIPELSWCADPELADQQVLVLPTGPSDPFDGWQLTLVNAAATATSRLWIASPYFVPDETVLGALQAAALRGVDVRILLPDRADHLLVYLSSFSYYPDVLPHGIDLYRYREGFMHQKVVLVDDDLAIVGTANLDNRSFRLNFEISAVLPDPKAAREVAAMLEDDFLKARRVTLEEFTGRPLWFRLACRISRLFAPIQ